MYVVVVEHATRFTPSKCVYIWSGCGQVVLGAGHKAKRLVLQCINGVSSNPVEGRRTI
jgi:hypothetical protein